MEEKKQNGIVGLDKLPKLPKPLELPELLAPAGSPEALTAAISAGADAVYFGGAAFSNRMRARNFDDDELTDAIRETRRWGVRSYITINTRVRDGEMRDVLNLVETLIRAGADGFITADMGIAAQIHSRYPEAHLHGSTQMTLMRADDGQMLADHGFTRMVVPREISLRELTELVRTSPLEIEMFLHGAYCVSVSGQCLMSWAMGGRSGNRGECAQPCRMAYCLERRNTFAGALDKITDRKRLPNTQARDAAAYPLSLKDMCLAEQIPNLIRSGVASLKIEGRQKPAPYVYGVTRIYRTLLDEGRSATPEEVRQLDALFSRGGFSDGYFRSSEDVRAYRHMGGIRPTTEEQMQNGTTQQETVTKFDLSGRADACVGKLTLMANAPAALTMTHVPTGITVAVTGDMPQVATGNPITRESALKNLTKLGGTPFYWEQDQPETQIGEGLWMPLSAINALRREGTERLEKAVCASRFPYDPAQKGTPYAHAPCPVTAYPGDRSPAIAVLTDRRQWCDEMTNFFETIFIPTADYLRWAKEGAVPAMVGADLPLMCFDTAQMTAMVQALAEAGCREVRFHSPGQLYLLEQYHLHGTGSFRLNLWNSDAMDWWYRRGAVRLTASPELSLGNLRTLAENGTPAGAIVYGHIPLMRTERCVLAAVPKAGMQQKKPDIPCGGLGGRMPTVPGETKSCGGCGGTLVDRTGCVFPMLAKNGETTIYNILPLWMADKMNTLPPLTHREFLFTIESAEEIRAVLQDTQKAVRRVGKRIK